MFHLILYIIFVVSFSCEGCGRATWLNIWSWSLRVCFFLFFFLQGGDLRYCQKCSHYKPPRAHHCRICNRCVLRMVCLFHFIGSVFFFWWILLDNVVKLVSHDARITTVSGWIIVWGTQTIRPSLCLWFMLLSRAYTPWYISFFVCLDSSLLPSCSPVSDFDIHTL